MGGTGDSYSACRQCPRQCRSGRSGGGSGFCGETARLRLAAACLHFGEEPPITVHGGSGTIFVTGCTLRCAFCQNYQISQQGMGAEVGRDDFVRICLRLQQRGAENINIVTGSHHAPLLADYLAAAREGGLAIPVAWNSSAYESPEALELLRPVVDIWLPDLKTLTPRLGGALFAASDYPDAARQAIRWMIRAAPLRTAQVTKDGTAREKLLRGTIIRHLFLPGRLEDTVRVLDWLKRHADGRAYVSLMSQYTPVPFRGTPQECAARDTALGFLSNRPVSPEEDADLRDLIEAYGFEHLFYQDLSDDASWLPDFARPQPFSNALAVPVWHWRQGFLT